ncbi:AAA family ATPase [Cellulomonas sp. FA1]|uniref:AAA family ATPase n=1 Tax=Cellulomonas sp. FA1 TaxID=1346710 RepID=UPI000699301C|nr:AAA family ATPase [Cellulomonas sp. FA1]
MYARFYRSLNYDYVRASDERYEADPWDNTRHGAYPFVRIRLRPGITTVVGANESGKSQVLRAVEAALTGKGYDRSDFCRYSRFFGVDQVLQLPEFGVVFDEITDDDARAVEDASEHVNVRGAERLAFFRMNETPKQRVYVQHDGIWSAAANVKKPTVLTSAGVPEPFRIDADVPLPDSVPIDFLATGTLRPQGGGRGFFRSLFDEFNANQDWFQSERTVNQNAARIAELMSTGPKAEDSEKKQYELAADLLLTVARLDRSLFRELQVAVKTKNGYANSIVDTINTELAKALDFRHWWSQDSQFELIVSLYEFDLVFMIRDRTGRSYGFDERSDGMKYFLSYFVQYLAHRPRDDGRAEVLLMDEPDRFLSSSGQQDLLRVFDDFADPKDPGRRPVQVVYVTHSPFLIDKNEADRIRVLEKGEHDEGTRVVNSAAANHYEPLRSAFGSFVAETTFIGNCNLVVEGPSDQVLIAGTSRWLKSLGISDRSRLDLNHITIVPAGGTRHIPYLVYLARGRDVEKPPVVALVDNDPAGNRAIADLAAGGAYGDKLINRELVIQLGQGNLSGLVSDNPRGIAGIEDLVPYNVALAAVDSYCSEFVPQISPDQLDLTLATVFGDTESSDTNKGILKHLQDAIGEQIADPDFHLDKVAFARSTVDALTGRRPSKHVTDADLRTAQSNFALLLGEIAFRQRQSERAESTRKISARVKRAKRDFTRTHSDQARKEDVLALVEEIDSQLDHSPESEEVRTLMRRWNQTFDLLNDQRSLVADFPALLKAIDELAYRAVREASGER